MVIAACRVSLHLPENHSLKGKRQALRSILARLRNEYGVSAAEVEAQDLWQRAVIGIAYVSNEASHANEVVSKAVNFIERARGDVELLDYELEILYPF
ncbi:MAG: DUF503 domain-containing protein [Chloroflexota bacterium]